MSVASSVQCRFGESGVQCVCSERGVHSCVHDEHVPGVQCTCNERASDVQSFSKMYRRQDTCTVLTDTEVCILCVPLSLLNPSLQQIYPSRSQTLH